VEQRRETRRAEEQILFQASLLNQVRNVIIATDLEGKIVHWNRYAETLFQWKANEVIGKHFLDVTVPEAHKRQAEEIFQTIKAKGCWEGEFYKQRKDGSTFPAYMISTAIKNSKVEGIVGVSVDITERKQLEQQLRQAQKMEAIGRLAGGVAHDFNNLLTAILGFSQLLLQRVGDDEISRREVEEVIKAGQRAAALTGQLLAFSRRQVMQVRALDMNCVVADLEKMLRRLIGEDIELRTSLAPNLARVNADPGQIEQVLMNLAVNARDAMPEGGKLTIETANVDLDQEYAESHLGVRPGQYVMLAVSDTGCGMDAGTQAQIFEPFYTTKEQGKGTGLGLATVYGIVKQSGGYVWVYSEVGVGTTFKVYLPQAGEAAEEPRPQPKPAQVLSGTETVLLVEDDIQVSKIATQVLSDLGYTVISTSNGKQALEIAGEVERNIDLVITDVVMPQMGGKQLAHELRAIRPNTKLLFMSGYTEGAVVDRGILDSGVSFLTKPFTPAELAGKVRQVLDEGGRDGTQRPASESGTSLAR
ncbi:MAG TPA: ATP-binding protein, partial [Blastocatellia bacterium]|nr:ATP-binding protein [Blastocatellia bacterium]